MLAAADWRMAFQHQEKAFNGAHAGTLNVLNQRKLKLNANRNRIGLYIKLLLWICETDPLLQLVPRLVTAWL